MSAEEAEDLPPLFSHVPARTREMLIQKSEKTWNFNLQ